MTMKRDALPGLGTSAISPAVSTPEAATSAPSTSAAPGWPRALVTLGVVLAVIVAAYFGTAAGMVAIWARSETFAHGFVIVPIALWLVWRMRSRLAQIEPQPSWLPLPFMAVAGFAWLVGEVGAVNALTQFAFVAMLVLAVPAVLGLRVARAMLFPLGFLFFAVPFGEFLMPTLMAHTADFTIAAVRASGVPVLREGLQVFSVPNGRWSVVEACSGVRYLIASVVVGTLFAYLNYRTMWRRLAFVGVSIAVPIVANWIRAYIIVMLGYLSENRIATGVDHIIYGWLFFGLVMLIMFWIGSYWREAEAVPASGTRVPAQRNREGQLQSRAWVVAAIALAAIAVWPIAEGAIERNATAAPVTLAMINVPGWQAGAAPEGSFTPHFQNPSVVRHEILSRGDRVVELYVGYYQRQGANRKLISSENVLLRAEDHTWHATREGTVSMNIGGRVVPVRAATIRSADGRALETRLFYWIDGKLTSSDAIAKALVTWLRVTGRYDGSAVVVASVPSGEGVGASSTLQDFLRTAWPAIAKALDDARGPRR